MTLRSTDYAALSQDAYKAPILNQTVPINGVDYKAIAYANDPVTGFQATAYEHVDTDGSHEVIFAYRGSEFRREPIQDGATDAGMVLSAMNAQAPDSEAFTKRVMAMSKSEADKNHYPVDFTVTGHSLGGTLAEINAHKFGLHGETFNAYGAAGLAMGIPAGGNQIIDNVRATDVVSAASPHFGQVRIFATPQDIDHLHQAGYTNNASVFSPRDLIGEVRRDAGDAHAIANFVPDQNGQTIMTASNQALAQSDQGMISRYRHDIGDVRLSIAVATGAEEAVVVVDGAAALEREISKGATTAGQLARQAYDATQEAVVQGAHTAEHVAVSVEHDVSKAGAEFGARAVQEMKGAEQAVHGAAIDALDATERAAHYVEREAAKGYGAVVDATSRGIESSAKGVGHVGQPGVRACETQVDAASHGLKPRLDQPTHPDHGLYQTSLSAVHRLDTVHGRTPDHLSANLAAGVAVSARTHGLSRVDHVVLSDDGSHAFAVQGDLKSPAKLVANGVDTAKAVNTPIAQHTEAMQQVQTQQHMQAQRQAQSVTPQHTNPAMTR
jgi:hypothetical protein